VFVVGDLARFMENGELVPGVAPAAIQQGRHAARNILHDLRGSTREAFSYWDKGLMATVGRASAVAQSGRFELHGFVAWLAWCFVHILYLVGFRNRLLVFIQWVWSWFRYRRGARLITEPEWKLPPVVPRAAVGGLAKPPHTERARTGQSLG
jgi:NADH:ubiquinone reductase (H+-translocating)